MQTIELNKQYAIVCRLQSIINIPFMGAETAEIPLTEGFLQKLILQWRR